jgi:cyclic pyranopterin phosphate synthase
LDQVVSGAEIVQRIAQEFPLEPIGRARPNDVATRYRYRDGSGEIGVVASVTQPFCGDCTRGRLSTDGKFFTCLFSAHGLDLRALLRGGASDEELTTAVAAHWTGRNDNYSERRSQATVAEPRMEMSYLGG